MNRSKIQSRSKRFSRLLAGLATIAVSAFVFMPDSAPAQDDDGNAAGINGFWEIELDGGRFVVRLDTISSVSEHNYIVDGTARVYEVTVDTTGAQAARFYYLEPATDGGPLSIAKTALDRAKAVANTVTERTGTDAVWDQVIKTYPDTTHARTAEYRLQSVEVLKKIYDHIHRVWAEERGKGKSNKLRIRETSE